MFLGLMSCQTVVDLDIPIERPRIVMNASLIANESPSVRLVWSKHILDNSFEYKTIPDALVTIHVGNQTVSMVYDEEMGEYSNPTYTVMPGTAYEIKVNVADYPEVRASDRVPPQISLDTVIYKGLTQRNPWSQEDEYTFVFTDPPGENFYEITGFEVRRFEFTDQNGNIQEQINTGPIYLDPKNPSFKSENNFGGGILFNDKLFDGKQVEIDFFINFRGWHQAELIEAYIVIKSVSESYFQFQTTSNLQRYNQGDPFAQPVQVFSNIENGVGILKSESSTTYVLEVEEQ